MATAELMPAKNVDDWVQSNPGAPAEQVIEVLKGQLELVREEGKMLSEVDIDSKGNLKPRNLAGIYRLGRMFASSVLVPEHFQGHPADCTIAIQMALRCGVDILTFLQSCYIVHGKPGIEAKLAIAMINSSGKIKGRIRWEMEGEGNSRKCTAFAVDAETGEELSETVDWQMVKAEGWDSKKGSKWMTIPGLMFKYRSAMWLIRLNFPDVLMGMKTTDELEDIIDTEPVDYGSGQAPRTLDQLTDKFSPKAVGAISHVGPEATDEDSESESENSFVPDNEPTRESEEDPTAEEVEAAKEADKEEKAKDPLAGVLDEIRKCNTKRAVQIAAENVKSTYKAEHGKELPTGDEMRLDGWCVDRTKQIDADRS